MPLILKDAMFQENGDLVIDDNNESGIYGDVILVNGVPWPVMKVEPRKYRFRILNASVSRSYDLSLDTGEPLDRDRHRRRPDAGAAALRRHVRVGMAERYEIVIDFSKYQPGQQVTLQEHEPDEQHRLRHDRRRHAVRRRRARHGPAQQRDPRRTSTRT